MIRLLTRSLSARLLAIFLLTSLAYAFGSRYAVELVLDRDYLREIVGAHIARYTSYLLDDLGYPPSIERARAIVEGNPYDLWIDGPGLRWASDPNFPDPDRLDFEDSEFIDRIRSSAGPDSGWAGKLDRVAFTRHDRHSYVMIREGGYRVVFVAPKISERPPPDLTWPIIGLVSVLFLALCYLGVRVTVRPVEVIKAGVDRIAQGDLDYRIPVTRRDELGELTAEINRLADDVQEMLEAKRQLLLAISHELRSPLTRAKLAAEFLDDDSTRASLLEDLQEMERLIDDLLEGEQLNTRHSKLQLTETDLATLIGTLLRDEFADQEARIAWRPPPQPVLARVDATRLRLLLRNLLNNALCYSPEDGEPVEVSLEAEGGTARIRVRDHGSGMSPDEVARATEPFYRADPARCRDTGGLGLGLYLCRRIAEAHGGRLDIDSRKGEGTTVSVTLPLAGPGEAA